MRIRPIIVSMMCVAVLAAGSAPAQTTGKRPMTFMDGQNMRQAGNPAVSPDGKGMLYTLSIPDWKDARSYTDIYLVQLDRGIAGTRQMTFTKKKNESSPRWSRAGDLFVFASNREAPASSPGENQLYLMRTDGGEARKITEAKDGVAEHAFSRDGKWLAFSAGKEDERQIWALPVAEIETAEPVQLTKHPTPVVSWQFSPDSRRLYFTSPDSFDKDNRERKEKKFDVRIRNEEVPPNHLWAFDMDQRKSSRVTGGTEYSVSDVRVSDDSKWIGFRGIRQDRYVRTITEANTYSDPYLVSVASGEVERVAGNADIGESAIEFSPDSALLAFAATDDFQYFRNRRIYVRPVGAKGANLRKLGSDFDGDLSISFWSKDGKTIYSNTGVRASTQLLAVSADTGKVTQVTNEKASLSVSLEDDSGVLLVGYTDPALPREIFAAAGLDRVGNRSAWMRLTDSNPQLREIAPAETEAVQWKSTDGRMVEGILVRPVGYKPGERYPLIVQIHGGPASADVLSFDPGAMVYAGAGYAVLQPNYRGSTNYGEKFKMEIGGPGNYFPQAFDDIMSGVDHLISIGLVDGNKMGAMGWSAGGHWSNWILTHTNRFKAISTGAGAMNWLSMYAQTDTHRNREYYFGGLPYDRFEHLWDISPLKYIKNAKTPTLIHVVDGDPRVPRPQSEELHMALKKLGVPTEFLVYPGSTHGIPDPRNRLVKAVAEFNWFEKWIGGKPGWLDWRELLDTLKDPKEDQKKAAAPPQ